VAQEHLRHEDVQTTTGYTRITQQDVQQALASDWRLGGRLVANQKEEALVSEIEALRAPGLSLREISRALARQGALARNGRPFGPSTLLGIVRNRRVVNTKGGS